MTEPIRHDTAAAVADRIIEALEGRIVLGLPLGLGKANRIANALYEKAAANPSIRLDIYTALSLEPPSASSSMENRFVGPLKERLFSGYERLAYAGALRDGSLPYNVTVSEFFLLAGKWLNAPIMQQDYISANYTHAAGYMLDRGINVVAQLIARDETGTENGYSLSCNTDITLDMLARTRGSGRKIILAGEVSSQLPFMGGEAVLPASDFDHVLDTPEAEPDLFVMPRQPVSAADHAIGIHAASLVPDGGTLQIGIGSLGDAVVAGLVMRHRAPQLFADTLTALCHGEVPRGRHVQPFEKGLYAASEMLVEGFADLYREGILKRTAGDGALVHSGFFLGSSDFYRFLRELPPRERDLFQMRGISFVNELYGDEDRKRADRTDARFINNAMMATALGDTVSDALEDGRVVSGVGGQYNFVAQAFALKGARSIITLNATRQSKGRRLSRIVARYGHTTIPRHLRDVFITEYGVADIRGANDRECVVAMASIADAEFQDDLLNPALHAGKIEDGFALGNGTRNKPDFVEEALKPAREAGYCLAFPFGTEFTPVEQRLLPALALLKAGTARRLDMAGTIFAAFRDQPEAEPYRAELERMGLEDPSGLSEHLYRRLLLWALHRTEDRIDART